MKKLTVSLLVLILLASAALAADTPAPPPLIAATFSAGGWNPADWIAVKGPGANQSGGFVQQDGCIVNETPPNATQTQLDRAYSSLVYKDKLSGDVVLSSTMAFTPAQAPLIVLAPDLPTDAQGQPQYHQHWEIVLFDQGVNVWRHAWTDGKPSYVLAAFARFPLVKDTKYQLVVTLNQKKKQMTVTVAGQTFGYHDELLPQEFYAGITGDEGINRFYDFTATRPPTP